MPVAGLPAFAFIIIIAGSFSHKINKQRRQKKNIQKNVWILISDVTIIILFSVASKRSKFPFDWCSFPPKFSASHLGFDVVFHSLHRRFAQSTNIENDLMALLFHTIYTETLTFLLMCILSVKSIQIHSTQSQISNDTRIIHIKNRLIHSSKFIKWQKSTISAFNGSDSLFQSVDIERETERSGEKENKKRKQIAQVKRNFIPSKDKHQMMMMLMRVM